MRGISIHTPTQGVTGGAYAVALLRRISIHTPTQGVTYVLMCGAAGSIISIHTPTQGVTDLRDGELHIFQFQSTLPRRE